jgi:hypothetical protein
MSSSLEDCEQCLVHVQSPSLFSAGQGATYQDDCSQRFSLDSQLWIIDGAVEIR